MPCGNLPAIQLSEVTAMPFEGEGQLESVETPKKSYRVRYRFEVVQGFVKGSQTTTGNSDGTGSVVSLTGEPIPLGQYLLRMSDGNGLHVQNDGWYGWIVLAPNPA